jgi:UPF0755 protein
MSKDSKKEKKYHDFKTMQKYIVLFVILFVLVVPVIGYFYYKAAVLRPNQSVDDITLVIESGEPLIGISQDLYDLGAVNSEFLFRFYILINGLEKELQSGVFSIPAGSSADEVAKILLTGIDDKRITFLEGWRVEEIAQHASENFEKIDYTDFINIAKRHEGYLFPDTYYFSADVTESEMINKLLETFDEKTNEMFENTDFDSLGLTKEEVVIFASILEREINIEDDKRTVAGILIKRYKEGMLIGADASTQYLIAPVRYGCQLNSSVVCPDAEIISDINWWPYDLTQAELDIKDPFNTRAVVGLPPTPIASPGLNSIEAVIEYEESPYYFYLSDKSGITRYAITYQQHNQNIQEYLR